MPVDDIIAPHAASLWWTVSGLLALLAIGGWIVAVLVATRRRPEKAAPAEPTATFAEGDDPFATLRGTYLAKVEIAAVAFSAEKIDVRELHLRLSMIVREFAGHRRGVDTTVMTLTEIEGLTGAGHLANLIARYYQPSFSESSADSGIESIAGARTVISQW